MAVELLRAAEEVGRVFQTIERARRPVEAAREALGQLDRLRLPEGFRLDAANLAGRLRRYRPAHSPRRDAEELLLSLEGRLVGRAIFAGIPSAISHQFHDVVDGRGELSNESIETASRWIRRPFIVGLATELRLPPVGTPRHVSWTRLQPVPWLARILGRPFYAKREDLQAVGSFKQRGATYRLLLGLMTGADPRNTTVITMSHGNHAQGVVQAAHNLGFAKVVVYLPKNTSPLKIRQLRGLGADVQLFGRTFEEAGDEVRRLVRQHRERYLFVHAYDDGAVIRGQGSIGREISLQLGELGIEEAAVLVPTGGGGLLAGTGAYLDRLGHRVFGVESMAHPRVSLLFRNGRIIPPENVTRHIDTVTDGIALHRPGRAGAPHILAHVEDVVALPEAEIEAALALLADNDINLEGAAAVPVAALLGGGLSLEEYGIVPKLPVVAVWSGRNIDPDLLREVVRRRSPRAAETLSAWASARRRVEEAVATGGFLTNGRLHFRTAAEARRFLNAIAEAGAEDWDLLDTLERLFNRFPRWERKKGITGVLRTLAMSRNRTNGDKLESIGHALGNEGSAIYPLLSRADDNWRQIFGYLEGDPALIGRAIVGVEAVDLYLAHERWLRGLLKWGRKDRDLPWLRAHLGNLRNQLRTVIEGIARRLGTDLDRLVEMTETEHLALVRRAASPVSSDLPSGDPSPQAPPPQRSDPAR